MVPNYLVRVVAEVYVGTFIQKKNDTEDFKTLK
jgi:hypothetical protein